MSVNLALRRTPLAGTASLAVLSQHTIAKEFPRSETLRVGIWPMAPSPDPMVTPFGVNWLTGSVVCEGLFGIGETWASQPMLDHSLSPDELVISPEMSGRSEGGAAGNDTGHGGVQ
jgi:peptide/nickel transport system substrate-binding protein